MNRLPDSVKKAFGIIADYYNFPLITQAVIDNNGKAKILKRGLIATIEHERLKFRLEEK